MYLVGQLSCFQLSTLVTSGIADSDASGEMPGLSKVKACSLAFRSPCSATVPSPFLSSNPVTREKCGYGNPWDVDFNLNSDY